MDKIKHIAFIMDGNGRWAKRRFQPRHLGHRAGTKALKRVIEDCNNRGIEVVSFYAFSTENWKRPQSEIDKIFDMVKRFANDELDKYANDNMKCIVSGDMERLPQDVKQSLDKIINFTKDNTGMIINLAINYGSRDEIVYAVNKLLDKGVKNISQEDLQSELYTHNLPDPDIIVRTSGEKRLSNFMLYQSAYSELIFIDEYWPEMDKKIMDKIVAEFNKRTRKFGDIEEKNNG